MREGRIMNGHSPGRDPRHRKNDERQKCLPESFAKNLRKSLRVETHDPTHFLLVAHVDEIVRASEKLIQIESELLAGDVFADSCQV